MANLRSYAYLTFYTKANGFFNLNSYANEDILAVTTHKDLSSPMGNFTILLNPRIAKNNIVSRGTVLVSDILAPFDLVQIKFKASGNPKTEMIGLVTRASVTLTVNPSNGQPVRALRIDGFDFGKALQSFKLFFNPFSQTPSGQEFAGQFYFGKDHKIFNNPGLKTATPAQFIQNFLMYVFNKVTPNGPIYPLTLPNNLSLLNLVDFYSGISTVFKQHSFSDPFILLGIGADKEVSIYDVCKAYSDIPFHEVFLDLRRASDNTDPALVQKAENTHSIHPQPSKTYDPYTPNEYVQQQPYVYYMRTTPFSKSNWNSINQHYFSTSDILHQDTAISEDNIFNYYIVICERENFVQGTIQVSQLAYQSKDKTGNPKIPIFDNKDLVLGTGVTYPSSIKRWGLKRFPYTTTKYVEFINATDAINNTVIKKQASLARELWRWYSFGELMESGTISLKGRVGIGTDGITMGSRLIEKTPQGVRTGKEYYVEGVLQEWVAGQPFKTTLSITRGHFPFQNFTMNGITYPGRFMLVDAQEMNLGLDQATNSTIFEDIP